MWEPRRRSCALVGELKRRGTAVILASTEPELVLAHADRILVLSRGRITQEFSGTAVDKGDADALGVTQAHEAVGR